MKPLKLRPLHQARAQALVEALGRHDEEPVFRALRQEVESELAKARRRAPVKPSKLPPTPKLMKTASGSWGTKALRWAVWERAEGRCENPACGRRIRWETFDLDHYTGRGKARPPQSPENTWALCSDKPGAGVPGGCHQLKHAGKPSRFHWHRVFLLHLEQYGFGSSETARGIRDELAAEEQLQEALRHAARARKEAEDLAERARRAEGATDA